MINDIFVAITSIVTESIVTNFYDNKHHVTIVYIILVLYSQGAYCITKAVQKHSVVKFSEVCGMIKNI